MAINFLNTATGITEAVGDNSTKIATTAYADAAASAIPIGNYLPLSAGATKPLTGSLYIPNYIYHVGDAGTFIGFPANDRLIIGTNGGTRVDITNSGFCLGDSGSNISVSTILDEDDMASDSATALVTQQSIKAYVDAQTPGAGVFLPLAGGTLTGALTGTSATFGGNVIITTSGAVNNLLITSTDTTTAGAPDIVLYADAPAVTGDTMGDILFQGQNGMVPSSTSPLTYTGLFSKMVDKDNNHSSLVITTHKGNGSGAQALAATLSAKGVNNSATGTLLINPSSVTDVADYNLEVKGDALIQDNFYVNGNVGIGTTNPGAKLEVVGGGLAAYIYSSSNTALKVRGGGNSTDIAQFQNVGGSTVAVIDSAGNVGIGTTSPDAKLEVVGSTGVIIDSGTASSAKLTLKGDNSDYGGGGSVDVIGGALDYMTYSLNLKNSPGTAEAHNYYYQYSGGWAWDGNETGNRSQPYTSYDFKSQGSSQMVIYNNNVGIGTTSPGVKLTILSTYAAGPTLGSSTVGGQALLGENGLFGQYSGVNSSNGDVWHQVQRNDTATSYNMHLQPAGGNVTMGANVIVANGLLGIGTTTLSNRLSVGGSGQNWDTSPAIKMWDSYNSKGWYVGSANNNTIGDFYIRSVTAENLYPVAADQQFTIKQSGNVGIGTISPSHKLDVAGDIRLQNDNQIYFGSTGSIPYWTAGVDNTTNNNFLIGGVSYYTGDRDILLNPVGNGNVGIKTTSPSYELDVVGDIRARGNGTGNIYSGTYGARLSNYYSSITTNAEFRVGYAGGTYAICRASAFTVTSDYRLKEKIVPLTDSLDRLGQLNVYKFNWIDKPNEEPVDGFIAHEVAEVIPEAVVGVKDEIGPDGKPEYQGLDQAKIVPLLTAALQQAIDKIEALEVRINKLENK